jgi:2,3-bisphosphoglycerate-independent phosphoglycerate mutase
MKAKNPTVLVILDGFGYSTKKKYNAIAHAHMPYFNAWWQTYPHTLLSAAGKAVGLPDDMIGNSEVGHLTIGAGRIIDQPMTQWLQSIADNSFFTNPILQAQLEKLLSVDGALHIIGLLSDAGVHGHEKCIEAVVDVAVKAGIKKIVIHAILDGRDVAPQSAHDYLHRLAQTAKHYNHGQVIIGSLHGRFYAMDRDHHWDRIEKSYRILTEKQSEPYDFTPCSDSLHTRTPAKSNKAGDKSLGEGWEKVLERNYAHNITDEFIVPVQLDTQAVVHNGDGIVFCNVRPDRARELTQCFVGDQQSRVDEFVVKPINLTFFITPVDYGDSLNTIALFPRTVVRSTLKDVLAEHGKIIFTIAETEKYAHVTYFFRGENEEPVAAEVRHMIPSFDVRNYIANPQMCANQITQAVITSLQTDPADFYLINYANADMVGHSGNFDATIKAVECLDQQLGVLYEQIVEKMGGTLYITADHGKAEDMFDEVRGQVRTAHTNNPVPFLMLKNGVKSSELDLKELADVAPFILRNMGIEVPREMLKD